MGRKKLLVDVDTGVDDAEALMLALALEEEVDIVGITCVNGNTNVDQVCLNTLRVLRVCKRDQIPVYKGAKSALLYSRIDGTYYHGSDGLGGMPDSDPPDISQIQQEHAVNALIRLAKEDKGKMTLVCLGPLTNIALVLRLEPNFGSYLKEAVIMGGNIEGRGNITTSGEFNFYSDPEAAYIVLNELCCPIKLVAWEPCVKHGLEWDWYDTLHKQKDSSQQQSEKSKFHSLITKFSVHRKREISKRPTFHSCDPFAMTVAVNPLCVQEVENVYCTVETRGDLTRGQMVVDWNRALGRDTNVAIVTKIDTDIVMNYFVKMLQ